MQKPYQAKKAADAVPTTTTVLDYGVGDQVSHCKFGNGIVKKIEQNTKDYVVTVEFETAGVKKMMAGFAKLVKL